MAWSVLLCKSVERDNPESLAKAEGMCTAKTEVQKDAGCEEIVAVQKRKDESPGLKHSVLRRDVG